MAVVWNSKFYRAAGLSPRFLDVKQNSCSIKSMKNGTAGIVSLEQALDSSVNNENDGISFRSNHCSPSNFEYDFTDTNQSGTEPSPNASLHIPTTLKDYWISRMGANSAHISSRAADTTTLSTQSLNPHVPVFQSWKTEYHKLCYPTLYERAMPGNANLEPPKLPHETVAARAKRIERLLQEQKAAEHLPGSSWEPLPGTIPVPRAFLKPPDKMLRDGRQTHERTRMFGQIRWSLAVLGWDDRALLSSFAAHDPQGLGQVPFSSFMDVLRRLRVEVTAEYQADLVAMFHATPEGDGAGPPAGPPPGSIRIDYPAFVRRLFSATAGLRFRMQSAAPPAAAADFNRRHHSSGDHRPRSPSGRPEGPSDWEGQVDAPLRRAPGSAAAGDANGTRTGQAAPAAASHQIFACDTNKTASASAALRGTCAASRSRSQAHSGNPGRPYYYQ